MPTRDEIIARAHAAFTAELERYARERDAAAEQAEATLRTFPAAATALDAHTTCLSTARSAATAASPAGAAELAGAEMAAQRAQNDADRKALDVWRRATDAAESKRKADQTTAAVQYEAASLAASRAGVLERDRMMASARETRDALLTACEAACRDAKARAWDGYQKSIAASREKAIAAIQTARDAHVTFEVTGAATLTAALGHCDQALSAALASEPLARSIVDAYQLTTRALEQEADTRKSAILAQMRRDLDALGDH